MAAYFGISGFFFPPHVIFYCLTACVAGFFSVVLVIFPILFISIKQTWSLFSCGFCSPSARIDLPGRILLTTNVSVLHLAAIAELPSLLHKYPLSLLFGAAFSVGVLGGEVERKLWFPSLPCPLPCPDMIGRLKVCFFVKSLVVQHLRYAEWQWLWYTPTSLSHLFLWHIF